ncbi:hypothetical protein PtB15_3B342 [Puccinia triticina]|nr:hypothetical protein PtB15_3B342 [Puccinia triticina]
MFPSNHSNIINYNSTSSPADFDRAALMDNSRRNVNGLPIFDSQRNLTGLPIFGSQGLAHQGQSTIPNIVPQPRSDQMGLQIRGASHAKNYGQPHQTQNRHLPFHKDFLPPGHAPFSQLSMSGSSDMPPGTPNEYFPSIDTQLRRPIISTPPAVPEANFQPPAGVTRPTTTNQTEHTRPKSATQLHSGNAPPPPTNNSLLHSSKTTETHPQIATQTTSAVAPRTAEQLEADLLAQITDFSNATQGVARGQSRGRARGTGRGSRNTRGGRGRGSKSFAVVRGNHSTTSPDEQLPDPPLTTVDELPENNDNPEDSEDPRKRHQLESSIMDELSKLPLDELRRRAAKYAEYRRLTIDDRIELGKAYFAYQREVYLIVCKRKLQINPALGHLGLLNRLRGSTNFNDFCKYDEVASITYFDESIEFEERMHLCGLLWKEVDDKTKEQWKDADFVKSKVIPDARTEPADLITLPASAISPSLPKSRFKLNEWARETKKDLRNLSTAHSVEGFVVLTSRDPESNILITGGSLLGEQFIDMMTRKTPNPFRSFFSFVSGYVAIKDMSGIEPSPPVKPTKNPKGLEDELLELHSKGKKPANLDAVRGLLAKALKDATHGTYNSGWPGTKTSETLNNLGVVLKVKNNSHGVTPQDFCGRPSDMDKDRLKRILCAFGEGWVEMTGPPSPQADEIGGVMEDEDSDKTGRSEAGGARNSQAKKALQVGNTRKSRANKEPGAVDARKSRTKKAPGKQRGLNKNNGKKFPENYSDRPSAKKRRFIISDSEDDEAPAQTSQQRASKKQRAVALNSLAEQSSQDGSDKTGPHFDDNGSSDDGNLPDV